MIEESLHFIGGKTVDTESDRSVDFMICSIQGHQLKKDLKREWNIIVSVRDRRASVLEKLSRVDRQCMYPFEISVIHIK